MIKVKEKDEKEFEIIVDEDGTRTKHIVTLDDEYYERLTRGKITKKELIERSFEFLLKREFKESILSRFNLKIINTYFPEYEKEIKIS
ncbi:MAG: hypothetical protein OEZ25_04780 [Candidatus Bathyarchaeota archaeon]|nr:hypothetical protein [Candidatus Bathyarchaeota archaeon]